MRASLIYPTIAQSASVSGNFDFKNGLIGTLWAPVITSAALYLQVSPDSTAANFTRVGKPDGTGVWSWAVGPGSAAIALNDVFGGASLARLETSVPQADVRTLTLIVRV